MTRTLCVAFLCVCLSNPSRADGDADAIKLIDGRIEAGWAKEKVQPSAVCADHDFIRRASLDLIGRIARPEEIERFFKDEGKIRRAKLIDRLLTSEEHARYWAGLWTSWLMPLRGFEQVERMEQWLTGELARNSSCRELATKLITATGKPADNPAVLFVLANLGQKLSTDRHKEEGQHEAFPLTGRIGRVFMGLNLRCVQCHCHPFDGNGKQEHFWSVNGLLRQIAVEGETVSNSTEIGTGPVFFEKRNGVVRMVKPAFIDGQKPQQGAVLRAELARFVVGSPNFGKAIVNRVWRQLFGRGIAEPVDDMAEVYQPLHRELLAELAKSFEQNKHDARALLRWLCNSKAYHLSSGPNNSNALVDHEPLFSRMLMKPLSARQLFDSISVATGATEMLKRELPAERRRWIEQLTAGVDDDEDNEVHFTRSSVQAHLLMNGEFLNLAIAAEGGSVRTVARQHRLAAEPTIAALYLNALNRPPAPAEALRIADVSKERPKDKNALAPWEDLLWALVNSSEFALNR